MSVEGASGASASTCGDSDAPSEVSAAVTAMARRYRLPGLSVAAVNRDRLLFAAGYGMADLAAARPATGATAYPWFSMTKVVTATAALRLVDESRIDPDAPVGNYLPYLRSPRPRQPSLRNLLTHTAGLANPMPLRWVHADQTPPPDPDALLRRLLTRRRAFRHPVGETAHYSNVGYLAIGQLIAAVTGTPFTTYVERAVLRPIGLRNTGFSYPPAAVAATGYVRMPVVADPVLRHTLPRGVVGRRHGNFLALNRFYVDGPAYGGLLGDAIDAARFLRLHLNDGTLDGQRIITPTTARTMREPTHPGRQFCHGQGWFRRPTPGTGDWVEHFGAGAGFWNIMRIYPERGLGIAMMANTSQQYDFDPVMKIIADVT